MTDFGQIVYMGLCQVMRGFLPSVLAACLLLQSSRAIKSIDAIFGGRTPPYVCDSFMYNNNDASRNTSNPDVRTPPAFTYILPLSSD